MNIKVNLPLEYRLRTHSYSITDRALELYEKRCCYHLVDYNVVEFLHNFYGCNRLLRIEQSNERSKLT